MSTAAFAQWQPQFAARGIPTFPVNASEKRPMVRGYLRLGKEYSRRLASQFGDATAYGFALGGPNRLTILDCDSTDERVLDDALNRHGPSPFVVRSQSGHFQAYYRYSGERRHIRPDRARPIDILGGGFAIGPGSVGLKGRYEIVQGSLDDLDRLPPLQNFTSPPLAGGSLIGEGHRNSALWEHCMRNARACDDFDALLDVAGTYNADQIANPLSDDEVFKAAASAWSYTASGQNRFNRHGAYLSLREVDQIIGDPCFFALIGWLRAHHSPSNEFMIADGLADVLGWPIRQLRASRNRGLREGWFRRTRTAAPGRPALYRWLERDRGEDLTDLTGLKRGTPRGGRKRRGKGLIENSLADLTGLPPPALLGGSR